MVHTIDTTTEPHTEAPAIHKWPELSILFPKTPKYGQWGWHAFNDLKNAYKAHLAKGGHNGSHVAVDWASFARFARSEGQEFVWLTISRPMGPLKPEKHLHDNDEDIATCSFSATSGLFLPAGWGTDLVLDLALSGIVKMVRTDTEWCGLKFDGTKVECRGTAKFADLFPEGGKLAASQGDEYLLPMMIDLGFITAEQLADAEKQAKMDGSLTVIQVMLNQKTIDQGLLAEAKAAHFGQEVVNLRGTQASPDVIALIPGELARKYKMVPVFKGNGFLVVATANPEDLDSIDSLGHIVKNSCGLDISTQIASADEIAEALEKYYPESEMAPINAT